MNTRRALPILLSLLAIIILACICGLPDTSDTGQTDSPAQEEPADEPRDTATPRPPTPKPTETAIPTETLPPPPVPVGEPVQGSNIEVTVVDVIVRDRIYPGGVYLYSPKAGFEILDFGVKVTNLVSGHTQSIQWSNVYIVEENGDSWYPIWGGAKMVPGGSSFDPFSIGISEQELVGTDTFEVEEDTYLRLIYIVQSDPPQTILFAIEDTPFIVYE
jgi:hypothetical protein